MNEAIRRTLHLLGAAVLVVYAILIWVGVSDPLSDESVSVIALTAFALALLPNPYYSNRP